MSKVVGGRIKKERLGSTLRSLWTRTLAVEGGEGEGNQSEVVCLFFYRLLFTHPSRLPACSRAQGDCGLMELITGKKYCIARNTDLSKAFYAVGLRIVKEMQLSVTSATSSTLVVNRGRLQGSVMGTISFSVVVITCQI